MSTRAQIRIIDEHYSVDLYHHHNGYPEGVGAALRDRLDQLSFFGHCMHADDIANYLIKDKEDDEYELTVGNHIYVEYLYEIDCRNRTLRCFHAAGHYHSMDFIEDIFHYKGSEIDL